MPYIEKSSYKRPFFLPNGHIQTAYVYFNRKVTVPFQRERISTPDDDFLDLDWSKNGSDKLIVLSHGLEGNSRRFYMMGMAKAFKENNYDVLAWNYRGCSGEPNKQPYFYHAGATHDLETVISHAISQNIYREIALIGFSLGGNLVMKYVGERGKTINPIIKRAVAISAPCDLASGAILLAKKSMKPYMNNFLRTLSAKVKEKAERFPNEIDTNGLEKISNFREFDGRYIAPLFGFDSAEDYWEKASSLQFIPAISIPTLLVNAENDPFLGSPSYPTELAKQHPHFYFESPLDGGHLGFPTMGKGYYWTEQRALAFIKGK